MTPVTPTAYSGPTPIPIHAATPLVPPQPQVHHVASPIITQPIPSPTTPTVAHSPVKTSTDGPKPAKKPNWMRRDLDIYRKEKMASSGTAAITPAIQQPNQPVKTPIVQTPPECCLPAIRQLRVTMLRHPYNLQFLRRLGIRVPMRTLVRTPQPFHLVPTKVELESSAYIVY